MFGFNMLNMPGFHFSPVNYTMLSSNPCDSINLLWNQCQEDLRAKSIMYMAPNFNFNNCWGFGGFGMMNQFPDPKNFMQLCLQGMQNNGAFNINNSNGNNSLWNFPNINNSGNNTSKLSDQEKVELEKVKDEIKFLTGILTEVKNLPDRTISSELKREIEVALKKTSDKDNELEKNKEILATLQSTYKKIPKLVIKKLMPTMTEVKEDLFNYGFNFSNGNSYGYTSAEAKDTQLKTLVTNIDVEIAGISDTNPTAATNASGLQSLNIISVISAWNDTHKADERSIIRAINKQMNKMNDNGAKISVVKSTIQPMVLALQGAAREVADQYSNTFSANISESVEKISTELTEALKKAATNPQTNNLNSVATKFEALYLLVRKISAIGAQKELENKYKFIDDIESGTSDDVFTDNLFKKATIDDLKAEGFNGNDLKFDNLQVNTPAGAEETAEDKVKRLISDGKLQKCPTPGIHRKLGTTLYWSTGLHNRHCQCFVIRDGELKQIDCTYIDEHGNIYMVKGNGQPKKYSDLTDTDFIDVDENNIATPNATTTTEEDTSISNESGNMYELADKLNLERTTAKGYYKKGNKIYKYNPEESKFELLTGVTSISPNGRMLQNNSWVDIPEVEVPDTAGQTVWNILGGKTDTKQYNKVERKLRSFSTYSDPDKIIGFIKGYNKAMGTPIWNNRLCAQISTEDDMPKTQKEDCLRIIAKQILKVMDSLEWDPEDQEYQDMEYYANEAGYNSNSWKHEGSGSWSFWNSARTGAAQRMDDIIAKVLKASEEDNDEQDNS